MTLALIFVPTSFGAKGDIGPGDVWIKKEPKPVEEEAFDEEFYEEVVSKVKPKGKPKEVPKEEFKAPQLPTAELLDYLASLRRQLFDELAQIEAKRKALEARQEAEILLRMAEERELLEQRLKIIKALIQRQEDETLLVLMVSYGDN